MGMRRLVVLLAVSGNAGVAPEDGDLITRWRSVRDLDAAGVCGLQHADDGLQAAVSLHQLQAGKNNAEFQDERGLAVDANITTESQDKRNHVNERGKQQPLRGSNVTAAVKFATSLHRRANTTMRARSNAAYQLADWLIVITVLGGSLQGGQAAVDGGNGVPDVSVHDFGVNLLIGGTSAGNAPGQTSTHAMATVDPDLDALLRAGEDLGNFDGFELPDLGDLDTGNDAFDDALAFDLSAIDTPTHAASYSGSASSEDISTYSEATQVSPGYGLPTVMHPHGAAAKFAPILPRPASQTQNAKRPMCDSENSGSESATEVKRPCTGTVALTPAEKKAAERERARIRAEKNRQSAAESRLRQKRTLVDLTEQANELRGMIAARDAEITRLTLENQSLKEQVAFFRSIVGEKFGSSADALPRFTGSRPGHSSPPYVQGVVCLAVCLAFAVCIVPSSDSTGLSSWLHGGPALGAGVAGVPASNARALLSNDPVEAIASTGASVAGPAAAPPVPNLLLSPAAAITMALYSVGLHHTARTVLTVAIGALAVVLFFGRRAVGAARTAAHRRDGALPTQCSVPASPPLPLPRACQPERAAGGDSAAALTPQPGDDGLVLPQ